VRAPEVSNRSIGRPRAGLAGCLLGGYAVLLGVTGPVQAATDELAAANAALAARDYGAAAREYVLAAERSADVQVAERATQFTFVTGYDGFALRAARRWIELAPDNPLGHEVLGRLNLRRHEVDAAARELSLALGTTEPRRDEAYLALGAGLAIEDDARLVTRVLARMAGEDPLAPGLQLALGNAALRSQDLELAAAAAATASIDDPDWDEPQLLGARVQAAAGEVDAGLARIAALETGEDRAGLALERVRLLEDAGRTAEARTVVDELALRFGERPPVVRARAYLDMRDEQLEAAVRGFESLTRVDDSRFEAFYYLGQIARDQGDGERGRQWLARITQGPYLVPAQLAIAESLARDGQRDAAIAALRQFATDQPPQAFEVLDAEAQLLIDADRLDEALATYDRALGFKPESPAVLMARGALLERLGRIDDGLADMRRAADIARADPVAQNAYGYTLANRTRRASEAYRHIRAALEQAPDSGAIQDSMGWVLFKLGRKEEARSWLETAFATLPDPEVAAHLAETVAALGERERASELMWSALVADPDNAAALETAQRLRP
jgi:tetratricopeptide (TPR) repeat protein